MNYELLFKTKPKQTQSNPILPACGGFTRRLFGGQTQFIVPALRSPVFQGEEGSGVEPPVVPALRSQQGEVRSIVEGKCFKIYNRSLWKNMCRIKRLL
jgi:hypothetical protein